MTLTQEQSTRLKVLNSLLTCPHRGLDAVWKVHAEMVSADPRFYVRMAAWYADTGDVRDHKEVFCASLSLSKFPGHRDAGLALLADLPLYQVARVVDFISGRVRMVAKKGEAKKVAERTGLFKNVPRSLKTEVARLLREKEAQPATFDRAVIYGRKDLKRLYALLHVKPSPRAQAILFDDDPPADSLVGKMKRIAASKDPVEQARAIVENKIPYRVATGLVTRMTPTVLIALIESMSPQELINSLKSIQKHGAFEDLEVKQLVERKIQAAQGASRVSAYKAKEAAKAAPLDKDLEAKLHKVTEAQIAKRGKIRRATALLVDKSGSMTVAIELGKRIGAMVSSMLDAPLYVYAFDSLAHPIENGGADLLSWEKTFAGIVADGATSCGVAVDRMRRKNQKVEQIVIVTDEGENHQPFFAQEIARYQTEMSVTTDVVIVKTPGSSQHLEQTLKAQSLPYTTYEFSGDYYALPNLAMLLSRPSQLELLEEIMEFPLPKREGVQA
jgi:hypothetical protein